MQLKKLALVVLATMFVSNIALAECDFSTGITKQESSYLYTKECHVKVGEMKRDLLISQEQIDKLNKSLDLKDIAIGKANERADLWMNTTFKIEDRVESIDKMRRTNEIMYFGIGMLTMFAAVYAAGQLK